MVDQALSNFRTIKELEGEMKILLKKRNEVNLNIKKLYKEEKGFQGRKRERDGGKDEFDEEDIKIVKISKILNFL